MKAFDRFFTLAIRQLRLTGLTWVLASVAVSVVGCGSSEFPTARTVGTVVCEGQPVSGAFVYFEPIAGGKSVVVGKGAFARTDESGKFVLTTFNADDGAVIGSHRVRVGMGSAKCPCEMNDNKDLMTYEVVQGDNEVEIVLPKADPRRPVARPEDDED